jgi:hypothetical protein
MAQCRKGNSPRLAACLMSSRYCTMRAATKAERLSLAQRGASARQAAPWRGRLADEAFARRPGIYRPILLYDCPAFQVER